MLVKNYGLFWRRDQVHWGKKKNAGHLLGVYVHEKTGKNVNFREQQVVYVLYDRGFELLYVGQAGGRNKQRLFSRIKQHTTDQLANRWELFSWFGIQPVDLRSNTLNEDAALAAQTPRAILDHIEAILIVSAEPPLNRQGGRWGNGVRQYAQYRDMSTLGPDSAQMLKAVWQQSKSAAIPPRPKGRPRKIVT